MCNFILVIVLFITVSTGFGYNITETPEGWASMNGGTTGGIGGEKVSVSTYEALKKEAESVGKKIILVEKGTYKGDLNPKSDKSILGVEPGVVLDGMLFIANKEEPVRNVIVRNIAVTNSKKCSSYGACKVGSDAVYIGLGAMNVWLDHVDISDGQDGNCDVTRGADFVTITWCKFWYSYNKPHAYSNLIAGSGGETESRGKLNITYAYGWWGDNCQERQPWGRFGKIHILNNLYTSKRARYCCASGKEMQMLIENNVFNNSGKGYLKDGGDYKLIGNIGTNKHITGSQGNVFTPPYNLSLKMDASEVEARVRAEAGNTLKLEEITGVKKGKMQKSAIKPYTIPSETGLILFNPTSLKLAFTVFKINGQTVLPKTYLEAGKCVQLPSMASLVYIRIWGADIEADGIYLPFK